MHRLHTAGAGLLEHSIAPVVQHKLEELEGEAAERYFARAEKALHEMTPEQVPIEVRQECFKEDGAPAVQGMVQVRLAHATDNFSIKCALRALISLHTVLPRRRSALCRGLPLAGLLSPGRASDRGGAMLTQPLGAARGSSEGSVLPFALPQVQIRRVCVPDAGPRRRGQASRQRATQPLPDCLPLALES